MSGDNKSQQDNAQKMHEINNQRESWCTVELNKSQDWCRAERKHSKDNFKSTVFNNVGGQPESEPRCTFQVNDKTHKERRHFNDRSYYSHLAI
ncbi:protein SPATA45 homolog [Amphiura filiformis]|uniref:protein SPATA45 homolog n=1 Tax=Amphiura filiformis TaxID=82378 RepID=UPI003B21D160